MDNKLKGQIFNRLTVIEWDKTRKPRALWKCLCECGNIAYVPTHDLVIGHTKSCGCYKKDVTTSRNKTHGRTHSTEYSSWKMLKDRCYNQNNKQYKDYGGRGITVCDRWLESFENFLEDMGERPEGNSLDRINNNGNYCKENCRWVGHSVQGFNQRKRCTNTSGRTGVYRSGNNFVAQIGNGGQLKYLGSFKTFEEAVTAREAAELEIYGFVKE